jgi:uncharacterized phage protein gp47/JayE
MTLTNIPKLVLDAQNEDELTQLAYNRIQTASGNTINDFRPGSAIAAFVEGQTFALAELLYYMNMMPEAIAIEVFRLYGIDRSLGTNSTGELTFVLTAAAVDAFVLPAGYQVPYIDTNLTLLNTLYIAPGNTEATVGVICDTVGARYNAKPYDISVTSLGLARVQSIFNRKALTGGSDLESIDDLVARCQAATVSRDTVITKLDYELAAQKELGNGSRAVLVPNVGSDGITYRVASVGLFMLDATGKPASLTTCLSVRAKLIDRVLVGTDVNCFPATLTPVVVEVFCNVLTVSDEVGQAVCAAIEDYMNPITYNGGLQLRHNELEFIARKVNGVTAVDSVLINGEAIDLLSARRYDYFFADVVIVTMIDPTGRTYVTYGGTMADEGGEV